MKKRILLTIAAVAAVAVGVVGMSAFEAHVINVTAHIENALSVLPDKIEFGTVFPQEYLTESVEVALSNSFLEEDRADNVQYIIRQKPKPSPEPDRQLPILKPDYNQYLPGGQFEGQLYPHFINDDAQRAKYCHSHKPVDPADPNDLYYINCYPLLCPYISKHPDTDVPNDDSLDAFHEMDIDVNGNLVRSTNDTTDNWTIDLDVPCFEGQCAQDWTHDGWELPASLESKTFGCDLWVEVTGINQS